MRHIRKKGALCLVCAVRNLRHFLQVVVIFCEKLEILLLIRRIGDTDDIADAAPKIGILISEKVADRAPVGLPFHRKNMQRTLPIFCIFTDPLADLCIELIISGKSLIYG